VALAVDLSSSVALTPPATWVGKGTGGTAGPLIGTAPVDATGKFALVPPPLSTPPPDASNVFTCQTSNSPAPAGTAVSGKAWWWRP
jgi:hypothetical protein